MKDKSTIVTRSAVRHTYLTNPAAAQTTFAQRLGRKDDDRGTIMTKWLFRISVSIGLVGMVFGIAMGMTHNFVLAPAHAHLNLVGWVAMFLSALYYQAVPEAATSRIAQVQAVVSVAGAILFPIGIACVLLGDRGRFMPVLVAGWLTVLTGMLLFVVIVYRSSGRDEAQATIESAGHLLSTKIDERPVAK